MFNSPIRPPRPTLTGPIFLYALADVFGLSGVAIGGSWFAGGKGAIFTGFPTSTAEAVACTLGGAAVMFWAMGKILREIAKQTPAMQARYDAYIAAHHPDKVRPKAPESSAD